MYKKYMSFKLLYCIPIEFIYRNFLSNFLFFGLFKRYKYMNQFIFLA